MIRAEQDIRSTIFIDICCLVPQARIMPVPLLTVNRTVSRYLAGVGPEARVENKQEARRWIHAGRVL